MVCLVQDPAVLHPGVLREPGGLQVVGPVGSHRLARQESQHPTMEERAFGTLTGV